MHDWDAARRGPWLGLPRDYLLEGKRGDWHQPGEDIASQGCPEAWARCGFVDSLSPYYRRRMEGGGRVENPALTQCTDGLVHTAIQTLEAFEESAHFERERRRIAQQKLKTKKAGSR